MKYFKIQKGKGIFLNINDELFLTNQFLNYIKKNNLKIIEYNICGDHIHFIIVCDYEKLTSIVQSIKIYTSQKFNSKKHIENLWAQKFNRKIIETVEQLHNSIDYIKNNRVKHNLPENKKLQMLIRRMLTPLDEVIKMFQEE